MADQDVSYKLMPSRNKTQKWQTAKQVDYGGDEWGEDEYDEYDAEPHPSIPTSQPASRQQAWGAATSNRAQTTYTDPRSKLDTRRLSFERDDDRVQLNTGQVSPHPIMSATLNPQGYQQRPQPALHLNTQPAPRTNRMSEYAPIPVIDPPDHRPPIPRPQARSTSPIELPAGNARDSYRGHPPGGFHHSVASNSSRDPPAPVQEPPISSPTKSLPFVRPADIYKRIEEEREKERKSQESARPSLDSMSRDHEDRSTTRSLTSRAGLDTLEENKAPTSNPAQPPEGLTRQASSVYSSRRDPVSATDDSSAQFTLPPLAEANTPKASALSQSKQDTTLDSPTSQVTGSDGRHSTGPADTSRGGDLSHQPSLGYTSVVHKAFDNEDLETSSPTTTTTTVPRSNSASTSEISPIITKKNNFGFGTSESDDLQEQAKGEEPWSSQRPESTATIKPKSEEIESDTLDDPVVPPGFRRDSATPSPGNSPARLPQSVVLPKLQGESAILSSTSGPSDGEIPSALTPIGGQLPASSHLSPNDKVSDTMSSISRTASQDYQQWTEQRRSFHAKHGIDDESNASATSSTAISRSETPNKGTVADIKKSTDVLDDSSAQPDLPNYSLADASRPAQQERLHSFRPSLPGGWQSDATIDSVRGKNETDLRHPPAPFMTNEDRGVSTDSIPTAKPPQATQANVNSPTEKAFAAAAAAGSALAGSFSGSAFSKEKQSRLGTDSESDADANIAHRSRATESTSQNLASQPASLSPTDPAPPPVTATGETDTNVKSIQIQQPNPPPAEPSPDQQRTSIDFPAPLRMSKMHESGPSSARPSAFSPTTVASDEDPEQLQHDIVQSLTPRPSTIEPQVAAESASEPEPNVRITREDSYDSVLPQEYTSYWRNESAQSATVHDQVTQDEEPQNLATLSGPMVDEFPIHHDLVESEGPPERPKLEQKFSWEKSFSVIPLQVDGSTSHAEDSARDVTKEEQSSQSEERTVHPPPASQRDVSDADAPAIPTAIEPPPSSIAHEPSAPIPHTASHVPDITIPFPPRFPAEKVDFQSILGYNDPHRRVLAFDDNRRLYAEHNGLLDHWLATLNIPEHADVFLTSRQQRTQQSASQTTSTPPRRDNTLPSSTRQMQEDGKRILAVAGKYGGKAGIAAKGLFAKGKDKFRTASAGDKVSSNAAPASIPSSIPSSISPNVPANTRSNVPSHVQTKSISDDVSSPTSPDSQPSAFPSSAPQLPTPTLRTPVEDPSWSLISSTIDQMFSDATSPHPRNDAEDGRQLSQLGIRGELTRKNDDGASSLPNATPRQQRAEAAEGRSMDAIPKPGDPSNVTSGESHTNGDQLQGDLSIDSGSRVSKALPLLPPADDEATSLPKPSSTSQPRRKSTGSTVSDMGRGPTTRVNVDNISQKVSPTTDDSNVTRSNTRTQEVPIFLSHSLSKEAEARQEIQANAGSRHTSLPPYSSPALDRSSQRVASGTPIVPIADLKNHRSTERRSSGRPFSFVGTDTMSSVPSYHPGGSPPPITPIDGQPRPTDADQKTAEPDIMEHPAYKQDNDDNDDAGKDEQEQATNPLPSSKRPPEELEQLRRQSQLADPTPEPQGYRIPGPYVQEYRSPRPKASSDQFGSPITSNASKSRVNTGLDNLSTEQSLQHPIQQPVQQTIQPPVRPQPPSEEHQLGSPLAQDHMLYQPIDPSAGYGNSHTPNAYGAYHTRVELNRPQEADKARNRTLGNIFRNLADSRNRDERQEPAYGGEYMTGDRKKRKPFFRLNNRAASPAGHLEGLAEEGHGQVQPHQRGHRRMLSSEMLKNKPFGLKSAEGRRKRTSGLAGLFSRSASKDKSRPSTSLSQRSEFESSSQQRVWQPQEQQYADYTYHNNGSRADQQHFNQYASPPAGDDRFGTMGSRSETVPVQQPRPDNLWVDTTIYNSPSTANLFSGSTNTSHTTASAMPITSTSSMPTTFSATPPVPVTRARRDISYGQDVPYIPPQQVMAEHVKNLNKRSRSPRMGKPPSDEYLYSQYGVVPGAADAPDPAENLGTFYSKKASPVGIPRSNEEQEKPWTITLPAGHEDNVDDSAKKLEATIQTERRGRHASVQVGAGAQGLTDSQNISDMLNKSTELKLASGSPSLPQGAETWNKSPQDTVQRQAKDRTSSVLTRTPSPFLSGHEANRRTSVPALSTGRYLDHTGFPRSTTPATSPPVSFRNFLNTTNDITRSTSPLSSSVVGNTITTTTTTTNKGQGGLVTSTNTAITPNSNPETFTPVDRPPSTAPDRSSQTKSSTPAQAARSPTPVHPLQSKASLHKVGEPPARDVLGSSDQDAQPKETSKSTTDPIKPVINSQPTKDIKSPSITEVHPVVTSEDQISDTTTNKAPPSPDPRPVSPVAGTTASTKPAPKPLANADEAHPLKIFAPVELPGSKPDGYESEDEPIMSATFMPGQEWMPTTFDRWED